MSGWFAAAQFLHVPAKGKPPASPLQFLDVVDRGLPVSCVDRVAGAYAPADADFRYRIVPKATLARLKDARRLNKSQSETVARLAEVWTDATRVWGSEDEARGFLHRGHPELAGRRPVDLALHSAVGAQLVRDVLGRLEHGTAV